METTETELLCNATPIGEQWPVCIKEKGHSIKEAHESWDYWWYGDGLLHLKMEGRKNG